MLKRHNNFFASFAKSKKQTAVLLLTVMFLCATLLSTTGCEITQRGNKRPLLRHDRIDGELELYTEKRSDKHKTSQTDRKSNTHILQEKLTLKTKGDIYHPNLIFFNAAVGVGLAQQSITSTQENGSTDGSLLDYNLSTQLLRTKKLPITFHTSRSEDLVSRQFLGSLKTERQCSGITTAWKSKDWPMKFQYSSNSAKQDSLGKTANDFYVRDDERFTYSVEHKFTDSSHMSFEYEKNDVFQKSHVSDIRTSSDRYSLLHDLTFGDQKQHRLDSYFSDIKQTGTFNYRNQRLQERLRIQHRDNFFTHYDLTMIDSQHYLSDSKEVRAVAGFEHQFYKSITTAFDVYSSDTVIQDQGDVKQKGAILSFDYNKKNSFGNFHASYVANFNDYTQNGNSTIRTVPSETHTIDQISLVPTVILNERDININSITVTDETMTTVYLLNDDYSIIQLGNDRMQLVFDLTGTNGIVNGQKIIVSYTYNTSQMREEETFRQNLTLKQTFNNGFALYYEYSRQDEDVISNTSFAIPDEYVANTCGIEYAKGGLLLIGEYRKEDSSLLPSETKRFESRYSWNLTNRTKAALRSSWRLIKYGDPDPRNIRIFRAGTEINTRINDKLTLAGILEYQDESDTRFGNTKGFQFNGELKYLYRQTNITTGLELNSLQRREDELDNMMLYFRLKRFF